MEVKEIVEAIRTDYSMIKTLSVNYRNGQDFIELLGMRYQGKNNNFATENQINFLASFNNVSCYKDNLKNANKWFISACINITKKYPTQDFEINVP